MLLQSHNFDPDTVYARLQAELNMPGCIGADILAHCFRKNGPYSTEAIARYMIRHVREAAIITAVRLDLEERSRYACPGLTRAQILAKLPPHTKGFMLDGQTRGVGHMRCIRLDQITGVWYAMDSW